MCQITWFVSFLLYWLYILQNIVSFQGCCPCKNSTSGHSVSGPNKYVQFHNVSKTIVSSPAAKCKICQKQQERTEYISAMHFGNCFGHIMDKWLFQSHFELHEERSNIIDDW